MNHIEAVRSFNTWPTLKEIRVLHESLNLEPSSGLRICADKSFWIFPSPVGNCEMTLIFPDWVYVIYVEYNSINLVLLLLCTKRNQHVLSSSKFFGFSFLAAHADSTKKKKAEIKCVPEKWVFSSSMLLHNLRQRQKAKSQDHGQDSQQF